MKPPRHYENRRPRPEGWKRTHCHVTAKLREERAFVPVPNDGQGYLLAPCVLLAAAIVLTKQAYHAPHYWLPVAREIDARRFA